MSLAERFDRVASDPDQPIGPHGETALHLAAQEGDAAVAAKAIAAGATAFVMDRLNNSPLIYAASRGAADVIRVIVRANKEGIDYSGNLGTALGIAAREGNFDAVRALHEGGANINATDDMGDTPLMDAVYAEEKEIAEFFLARGADANILRMGEGVLHLAARKGNVEILGMLLQSDAKQHLHQQTKSTDMTPLHIAVLTGQHDAAGILLDAGALTGIKNAQGLTPVEQAAQQGDAKMIRLLVEKGFADLRVKGGFDEFTALHRAAFNGKMDAVQELVRLGADPDAKDSQGRTAAEIALEKGYMDIAALLENPRVNFITPPSFPKSAAPGP